MPLIPAALAALALLSGPPAPGLEEGLERSVVRIVSHAQRGDWFSPWDVTAVESGTGSGFILEGGLVMTNAHVVSDARLIVLYLHGDPAPHEARVKVLGHDCDLALIEPVEAGLLDGLPAIPLGGLPALRTSVETYGFPAGGDQISSTRGVVSRIEIQAYAHSGTDLHLAVQTDAAINPGNSGGPVVQGGKAVGVAFQGIGNLENVGFFIPMEVVRHFLTDVEDGVTHGYPDLAIRDANLENSAARRRAGMADGETGVLVDFVHAGGSAEGRLEVGDILLGVEGETVANDGSVQADGLRISYSILVDRLQVGDDLDLRVLRRGERFDLAFPLVPFPGRVRHENLYDTAPRYFIYGGLVFVPLDLEMLKTFGRDWRASADKVLIHEHLLVPLADPAAGQREPVVLLRRLDHPVNVNLPWFRNQLVTEVNGRRIAGLEDLVAAIEGNTGSHHVLGLAGTGRFIVLDREAADQASPAILKRYGVTRDRAL